MVHVTYPLFGRRCCGSSGAVREADVVHVQASYIDRCVAHTPGLDKPMVALRCWFVPYRNPC